MINWNIDTEDFNTILSIADRASKELRMDKARTIMDLNACHSNGCPLDLEELSKAKGFSFVHDLAGIANHIDRDTGKLTDCFVPRYAKQGV